MLTIPNELVFDCTPSLLEELVAPSRPMHFNYGDYAKRFSQYMRLLHASPPRDRSSECIPVALNTLTHTLVRVDAIPPSLRPPNVDLFRVIKCGPKTGVLHVAGQRDKVSIDLIEAPNVECGLTVGLPHLMSHTLPVESSGYHDCLWGLITGTVTQCHSSHRTYERAVAPVRESNPYAFRIFLLFSHKIVKY